MPLSNFSKSLVTLGNTVGLVAIGNLFLINSVNAFDFTIQNGGFDQPSPNGSLNGWSHIGDVNVNTGIDGISPLSNPNQAILTTGYRNNVNNRNDDSGFNFNQSGTDPIDADSIIENNTGQDLQTFLGLDTGALSIERSNNITGFRTPKEGSGIYQDIEFNVSATDVTNGTNGFDVSFNWAYLTNDGKNTKFGNQDYGFVSIYDTAATPDEIELLGDSNQAIGMPGADNDFLNQDITFYDQNNTFTQSVTGLSEGSHTYRFGFGVVDVDNYDRTSALVIDNFDVNNVQAVPFGVSPTSGFGILFGIVGFNRLRRKLNSNSGGNRDDK